MKKSFIIALVSLPLLVSCSNDTIIYRVKPPVTTYAKGGSSRPVTYTKTIPGMPQNIDGPAAGGTSTVGQ